MNAPSAWEELEIEDLPNDDLKWLARHHGMQVAVALWRRCKGTSLDFPVRFPKEYSVRFIRTHFDGTNVRQLARSLEISERTVQEYLGARPQTPAPVPQLSFM
jgi:hypothetical protein